MKKAIVFLKQDRLYVLILIFVIVFNVIVFLHDRPAANAKPSEAARTLSAEGQRADKEKMEVALHADKKLLLLFSLATLLILAITLLGVVMDLIIVPMILAGRLNLGSLSPPLAKWSMWDVGKVAILFLFFGYILIISEAYLLKLFPIFKIDNFRMMVNSSILDTLAVVFVIYFTVVQYKEPLMSLGISARNFLKNILYGIVGYVSLVPVLILLLIATALVINLTKYVPPRQPVVELFLKEKGLAFLTFSSLFAAIVGPVIEELFFRGFMYGALKKYIGIFWAMMVTAGLFAALHAHIVGFFPIMALGILLAYLYEKTGTLTSSITVHMIHNLSMVLLVFLVKQVGVI